jgi:solute carrier family 1 (neuronal/epithelial high affinity glutamate transporter), member 1
MSQPGERKSRLHHLIFVGMFVGFLLGTGLHMVKAGHPIVFDHALWWLDLLGSTLFVGALKMIIAPLILASIVAGVTSLPNIQELGTIGVRTLVYYFGTTTIAVTIGLVAVLTIQPGKHAAALQIREHRQTELVQRRVTFATSSKEKAVDEQGKPTANYLSWLSTHEGSDKGKEHGSRWQKLSGAQNRKARDIFRDDIIKPLLTNPFESLSGSPPNALGIIFFSMLLGISCTIVGKKAEPIVLFFQGLNEVIMKITHWLMSISPFAIACIIANLVAKHGPEVFQALGWYCGTVIGGIAVHIIVLLSIAYFIGGTNPLTLWRGFREAWMIAFSTRSSAATLPISFACVTEKLGVRTKVANFTLPLGATMNMDGTALYEGVAVIFLIQIYGGLDDVSITMTAMTTFLIFLTAVLASVGAAAVPDAGLVTMVLVASAVHLPIYYIPLIFAVDALLDMFRTSTNVLGDAVGAIVVDKMLDKIEHATPPAPTPEAGLSTNWAGSGKVTRQLCQWRSKVQRQRQ